MIFEDTAANEIEVKWTVINLQNHPQTAWNILLVLSLPARSLGDRKMWMGSPEGWKRMAVSELINSRKDLVSISSVWVG